jgi:hypothetical protein
MYKSIDKICKNVCNKIVQILTKMQRGGGVAHEERRYEREASQNTGKDLTLNQTKSSTYSNKSVRKLLSSKGAILIEFAISIPVLVALMYYMHDLPKLARIHERMEFCAHCMVNLLQNCSQNRENRRITANDIRYAVAAAFLTIYPGMTMYETSARRFRYGHFPHYWIYYIVGESDGTASMAWSITGWTDMGGGVVNPNRICVEYHINSSHSKSTVTYGKKKNPSLIYPGLTIKPGEKKIILECALCYHDDMGTQYGFTDGRLIANVPAKKAFGFWILPIKATRSSVFFNKAVIFTPKPGLFSETPPQ